MRTSSKIKSFVILFLIATTALVWFAVWEKSAHRLTVSFLNVGQGDSIFIESPTGRQVLIDGGPNASVMRELSKVMPWWDRGIDVMIATHPDLDHIGGLIDVLSRYDIGTIVQSSVQGSTPAWHTFEIQIDGATERGAHAVVAQRGQVIDLGGGARLEILFPDRTVSHVETNVGCVVTRLVYGTTAFMLPCDTDGNVEKYLASLDGTNLKSNVLKAAHHGSKTSSSPIFVGLVDPEYAVYSRGCGNSYGHPHQQTIDTFARFNIPTLDTCKDGTITFVSDGKSVARRN